MFFTSYYNFAQSQRGIVHATLVDLKDLSTQCIRTDWHRWLFKVLWCYYARPGRSQFITTLVFNHLFFCMERGINSFSTFTYPSHHAGCTDNDPQIRKEVGSIVVYGPHPLYQLTLEIQAFSASLNPLLQSGPIQETYESWTEYLESSFPSV